MRMPHIIDVSSVERREKGHMPGVINIEATTTLTGEQKQMMDGIIHETRPSHKMAHAPGLPPPGSHVPLMKTAPTATKTAIGMRHIRGTKY
jgi:3-mercaptopyruvate sulfurtransferase SseA